MRPVLTCFILTQTLCLTVTILSPTPAFGAGNFPKVSAKSYYLRQGIPHFFEKLKKNKKVQIAYLGGSITAQNGWRPKTLKWFQKRSPKAKVSQINAAIGGTGSDLGAFRVYQDALRYKPDLLFVEFAVNDANTPPEQIYRAMEGIVRQTWKVDPTIDICFVYTISRGMLKDYQGGKLPRSASAMEHLADHYGIPSICMALRVAELEKQGKLIFTGKPGDTTDTGKIVFSKDSCHPTDAGHELFLDVIAEAMQKMEAVGKVGPHKLKKPFRKDNWEQAKMVPITQEMLAGSWRKMKPEEGLSKRFGKQLPEIWLGSKPGDTITFKFRGTMAKLYDLLGPDGGQVCVTVDGQPSKKPRPRFDSHCTYHRLGKVGLCKDLEAKEHTVVIEILEEQPDREVVLKRIRNQPGFIALVVEIEPFPVCFVKHGGANEIGIWPVSSHASDLVLARWGLSLSRQINKPDRYNGTNVWAGYLLILGDVVK